MANLSITPSNVVLVNASTERNVKNVIWGEAVLEGQAVYKASDKLYYLIDANATLWATASMEPQYIALTGGAAGQSGLAIGSQGANVTLGPSVMTAGDVIIVDGTTPGGLKTADQLVATEHLIIMGYASDNNTLTLFGRSTNTVKA